MSVGTCVFSVWHRGLQLPPRVTHDPFCGAWCLCAFKKTLSWVNCLIFCWFFLIDRWIDRSIKLMGLSQGETISIIDWLIDWWYWLIVLIDSVDNIDWCRSRSSWTSCTTSARNCWWLKEHTRRTSISSTLWVIGHSRYSVESTDVADQCRKVMG